MSLRRVDKEGGMEQMYIKYRGSEPVAYAYGEEWVAMALFMDDIGYPTPEEAKEAWLASEQIKQVSER